MQIRFFHRFVTLIFAVLVIASSTTVFASSPDAVETISGLSAESYCLMDAETESILTAKNLDLALPMASTTKIMTCILALEEGDFSQKVSIPKEAVGVEGSSVYLTYNEVLTMEELLYALMLESANDAAVAIALSVDETLDAFSERMNQKASELGMTSTHFVNPHGLPAEGHFSTARDLARLMAYCMKNQAFAEITATKTKNISAPDGKTRFLSNHNKLLRNLETCIGGKTGYTKTAGRCLVSAAEDKGKVLICVTLGDPNDWKDHAALYDYGFPLYEERLLAVACEIQRFVPLVGGTEDGVTVTNFENLTYCLRSDEKAEVFFELPAFVYAPTGEGEYLGDAVFTLGGKELARLPLYTTDACEKEPIEQNFFQKLWNQIKQWWHNLWNK